MMFYNTLNGCTFWLQLGLTWATEVVIFVPPEPPTTILILWFLSKMIAGHMEDIGLFPLRVNSGILC